MMFWSAVAALTALAVLMLVRPLARAGREDDRIARDLAVYRDQLRELDAEVERGTIKAEERDAARTEIERRMLRAADHAEAADKAPARASGRIALAIALLLPIVAVPIYLRTGAPEIPDQPLAGRTDALEQRHALERFEEMAERLASRLRETPDDLRGWRLLGRTYGMLERHDEAVIAYRRAVELDPSDAPTLSALGEALVYAANGEVGPEAADAFDRALMVDPLDQGARFYRALAFSQAGDARSAYDLWLALIKDAPADASWREIVLANLETVARRLGIDLAAVLPPPAMASGPTRDQVEDAAKLSTEDRQAFIRSMVERLADRLKESPDDLQGWMRLGQAYAVLGEREQAKAAFLRAQALAMPNSQEKQQVNERLKALSEN